MATNAAEMAIMRRCAKTAVMIVKPHVRVKGRRAGHGGE
jgi:hypothetical protein